MERFFEIRDRWGNSMALWVVGVMIALLPVIAVGLSKLDLENDVTDWLPKNDPEAAVLDWFHREFERDSKLLVSWDSSSLFDPRVEAYAAALRTARANDPASALALGVKDVDTPLQTLARMADNGVRGERALERLCGVLIGTGFANVRLTEAGRRDVAFARELIAEAVRQAVEKDVVVLPAITPREPPPVDGESLSADPLTQSLSIPPHDFRLRWLGFAAQDPEFAAARSSALGVKGSSGEALVEDVFVACGAPVAVAVSLTDYGDEHVRITLDAVRSAAIACGVPEDELRMGGSPVGRDRLNRSGKKALWNTEYPAWKFHKRSPVLLSMACGILMSFLMLGSIRLALLVLLASVYTCLVVLAIIPLSGYPLNMVLVVLPNLLLVLTMSGAIHVANYWRHCVWLQRPHPMARAVELAARPCFLASATTAVGMASLLTAVLRPVRDFGLFSTIGCGVSLGMILLGFPALMLLSPASDLHCPIRRHREDRMWNGVGRTVVAHRHTITAVSLALFALCTYGLKWFRTETKVIRYFPAHMRIVHDYQFLEEGLSGVVPIETVIRFDAAARRERTVLERMELIRAIEREIALHRGISGTLSLADFRPTSTPPPANAPTLEKIRYRRAAQRTEQGIFEEQADVARSFARRAHVPLDVALRGRRISVVPGDEIWRIRAQSAILSDTDYNQLVVDLNEIVHRHVENLAGVDFVVTGMVPLFLRTQEAVLQSLIRSFALAFAVIGVIMMILLRSALSGLLAMIPNLFPVGVVFGAVSWCGVPVDIGTMITASVALGIAIDGTLHLLTWFQHGIRNGLERGAAVVAALRHCGPAMWQTSLVIAIGMAMLAGADLLLISRFGWLMAAMILAALVGDAVLLPALLAGWLGRLIESAVRRGVMPAGGLELPDDDVSPSNSPAAAADRIQP